MGAARDRDDEESAVSFGFGKRQIPRFAWNDIRQGFFNELLMRYTKCFPRAHSEELKVSSWELKVQRKRSETGSNFHTNDPTSTNAWLATPGGLDCRPWYSLSA